MLVRNVTDWTFPLKAAAQQGKVAVVRTLVGYDAKLVESRYKGKSALMVAVHHGHLEIADLLLSSGAAIDGADDEGDQSVHYAVIGRQPPSVLQVCSNAGSTFPQKSLRTYKELPLFAGVSK